MERLECKQFKILTELRRKREIIESGCNILSGNKDFLYKYLEIYFKKITTEFDRVAWKQFHAIHDIELYAWNFWYNVDLECSLIEEELGIL